MARNELGVYESATIPANMLSARREAVRFDTSGKKQTGNRWQTDMRSTSGYSVRHPAACSTPAALATYPLTQAELARRRRLDRSVVSRLADALIARGWLRREPHPHDQRAVQLVLTGAGRQAAAHVSGARRARMATLLDAVPIGERKIVLHALDILARCLTDPATTKESHDA